MVWQQNYNPFDSMLVSTLLAAVPVVVMLVGLGFLHLKAHIAAAAGLVSALAIAVFAYGMPAEMAGKAAFSTASGPKTLVSNWARTSSREASSTAPTKP